MLNVKFYKYSKAFLELWNKKRLISEFVSVCPGDVCVYLHKEWGSEI